MAILGHGSINLKTGIGFIKEMDSILTWSQDVANYDSKTAPMAVVNADINSKISLWNGDITTLRVDAIQNAANTGLGGGKGIDGAIHDAAGSISLLAETRKLGGCPTGQTKLSKGYGLPSKHILHSVGPDCRVTSVSAETRAEQLKSSYITALELAKEHGFKTIALCGISLGIFECPKGEYVSRACQAVRMWMEHEDNWKKVDRVIFAVYHPDKADNDALMSLYQPSLTAYFPKSP